METQHFFAKTHANYATLNVECAINEASAADTAKSVSVLLSWKCEFKLFIPTYDTIYELKIL